jgi:hypothetical protein
MQRFVLEPILFAIFGELLYPTEPVEYLIPYSALIELYEMRDYDEIVSDPVENERVKQNLAGLIAFFEQPFVKKKIDKTLKMPWQKSTPILFSESVTFTLVFSIDNAEFGETFDPIETELILTAKREGVPIISDQLEFQQRAMEMRIPVTFIDVADFGFAIEEDLIDGFVDVGEGYSLEPVESIEAQEGALAKAEIRDVERKDQGTKILPWVMGGILLVLVVGIWSLF